MQHFTEQDLVEILALNKLDEIYVHLSWCIWHEGVRLFDDGFPGAIRQVHEIRTECANKQSHNGYAQGLIKNATNNELNYVLQKIERRVEAEHHLSTHFRWVAYHEGERSAFLDALDRGDFIQIRSIYSNRQSHNSNAQYLLCCVSNAYIKGLVDFL